jgi:transcriptional regulator with XRE-family HTH domain
LFKKYLKNFREINMDLVERIKFAREKASLSPSALAEKIGITPQAIQNWEYGKSSPKLSRLKKIAEVTSISEKWLVGGYGSPEEGERKREKVDDDIFFMLTQVDSEAKGDILKLIKQIVIKQRILRKYGIKDC